MYTDGVCSQWSLGSNKMHHNVGDIILFPGGNSPELKQSSGQWTEMRTHFSQQREKGGQMSSHTSHDLALPVNWRQSVGEREKLVLVAPVVSLVVSWGAREIPAPTCCANGAFYML